MSDFEFIFALFGLLLGLSITELLSGFARTIQMKVMPGSKARIGWLTPLLGIFVLVDLLSFWLAAWVSRDAVTVSRYSTLAVALFAGAYYLAATLVFPREPDESTDFDAHFFRVRRIVIGVLLALLACQLAWYASVPEIADRIMQPQALVLTVILALLMVGAMLAQGRRLAIVAMAALVGRYLLAFFL